MRNSKTHSDYSLIEGIKKGNSSDFRFIVDRYKDVSFSLACSILRDEHLAEDVLQDVFIKVYNSIHKFRGTSKFSTWLYRIVVNTSLSALKKHKKEQLEDDVGSDSCFDIDAGITSHSRLMASEKSNAINKALGLMKRDESLLLRLFYLSELNILEIIDVTGFSESKIKVTLLRGRKNLLGLLEKEYGSELKSLL